MSKIRIKKNDPFRILLTELLPYEVPMLFSNEGFYVIAKNKTYETIYQRIKELESTEFVNLPISA